VIDSDCGGDENSIPSVIQNHNRGQIQRHTRLPESKFTERMTTYAGMGYSTIKN